MNTVGNVRKLTLDGIVFRVAADANFSEKFTQYENEMIPSSGESMLKKVKKVASVEGVALIVNGVEREQLKQFNDQLEDITINYQTAAGDVYRTTGTINVDARETESGKCTITLLPRAEWVAMPVTA